MEYENVLYSKYEGIAHIVVNRPDKRNSLNRAARIEMVDALEDAQRDASVKVLILSGSGGKSFIAGSDLAELSKYTPLEMEDFMATLAQQFYTRFEQLEKPTIAMIDGLCMGGGLELAMACDLRIASHSSKFGQPEILLGIIPGGGGTQRLPRLIGAGRAKELVFTGKIINAAEAYRIGLVNQICPSSELEETVMSVATHMTRQSSLALKWAKRAINAAQESSQSMGLAYEALVECLLFSSADREEGIKAFFEKRKPLFTGK